MLNILEYGSRTALPDLLIVHGLYGSARNWGAIAKRMALTRRVISVDQRNHGSSPWFNTHSYEDMATDLAEVIETQNPPMDILGHSMGGKAAMALALTHPNLVNRLVVADIAPVAYSHDQTEHIASMRNVDLSEVEKRSDVIKQLESTVDDPALRSFFTQSVDIENKAWRLNLDVLEREMDKIVGWPKFEAAYQGPTLFLSGSNSEYVRPEHRSEIRKLFPAAQFAKLNGAGHWLHAEKPREFIQTLQTWLGTE